MAIDPSRDKLVPLSQIARSLPKKPSPACLWRWHAKGVRGIRLETVVVGGRRYTTERSWSKFVQATTAAAEQADDTECPERPESVRRGLVKKGLL